MLPQDDPIKAPDPPRAGTRGREVNRRIAGGDLQRIVAQVRLVRRVYGVGALSTAILAGVLVTSLAAPGVELGSLGLSVALLCVLVSVQLGGALFLPRSPKSWSLGLAGLQSAFYGLSWWLGQNSGTQLLWLVFFWLAVGPMGRAEAFRARHGDLYAAQLIKDSRFQRAPRLSMLLTLGACLALALLGGWLASAS